MFLAVWRSWADHDTACRVDAVSGMEKGDDRWPEAASHYWVHLGQPLTLKLADNAAPPLP
jgi:hypothetical protein